MHHVVCMCGCTCVNGCTFHCAMTVSMSYHILIINVQDAFILDTGAGGIFAWLGSGATQQEKKAAFKNAVVSVALWI